MLCCEAAAANVRVELIIRGMCSLYPGREGLSESISVVSIIGQFLEHSRIFWFGNGGSPEVYIGSGLDEPQLDRRVEAARPWKIP